MTITQAAFLTFELFLIILVGVLLGRVLGRMLIRHLRGYTGMQCRYTDSVRIDRIRKAAGESHKQATEARMAAEALEQHLKGAAHV